MTFQPQNHIISRTFQGLPLYQVGTICYHLFLSYAADRQTDKQTDRQKTDSVGMGNN